MAKAAYLVTLLAVFVSLATVPTVRGGTTYYISPDGDDQNDGLTPAAAFASIQKGVDMAGDPDIPCEATIPSDPCDADNPFLMCDPDDYDTVHILEGTYLTGPIFLNNHNQIILFDEGVEVIARSILDPCQPCFTANVADRNDPNSFCYYKSYLFRATLRSNLILRGLGNGATLRMRRSEYAGESRHVIGLLACTNVQISNLVLRDGGGEGLFIHWDHTVSHPQKWCKNIHVTDVICDNNKRNAMVASSVENLLIENCILENTVGTLPKAGIDLEPPWWENRLKNIVVRDCLFKDNGKQGISVSPQGLTSSSEDISIRFEDCLVDGAEYYGLRVSYLQEDDPNGLIEFDNVTVRKVRYGVRLIDKSSQSALVRFNQCVFEDFKVSSLTEPISVWNNNVSLSTTPEVLVAKSGGVEFIDCQVLGFYQGQKPVLVTHGFIRDDPARENPEGTGLWDFYGNLYVQEEGSAWADLGFDPNTNLHNEPGKQMLIHPGLAP